MSRRRQNQQQRIRLIMFLGGCCYRCGEADHRGLVIVQPPGVRRNLHETYTLILHEPELAADELQLRCATCHQIERYQDPSVAPSMSSADVQPSTSDDQPLVSSSGGGALRETWGLSGDSVAFG